MLHTDNQGARSSLTTSVLDYAAWKVCESWSSRRKNPVVTKPLTKTLNRFETSFKFLFTWKKSTLSSRLIEDLLKWVCCLMQHSLMWLASSTRILKLKYLVFICGKHTSVMNNPVCLLYLTVGNESSSFLVKSDASSDSEVSPRREKNTHVVVS